MFSSPDLLSRLDNSKAKMTLVIEKKWSSQDALTFLFPDNPNVQKMT